MEVDYYSLLGIPPHATKKEIKMAYRRMAEVYHPDKLRELPPKIRSEGEDIMRLLNEAKSVLLDADKRYLYDLRLGTRGSREDAIIVKEFDQAVAFEPETVMVLEKEEVRSRMFRVLNNLKEVFVKDGDFQNKISAAEEVAEAKVIEEPKFRIRTIETEDDENFETIIEGEEETSETRKSNGPDLEGEEGEEVEMTLEFARVTVEKEKESKPPRKKSNKKEFHIVAVETEDEEYDDLDDYEVQEVEWEE
ncbi:MAG: DnaJ domain-containing protein [Thermoplasmatota archaeon]